MPEFHAVSSLLLAGALAIGVGAADLMPTPQDVEGPFYPDRLPLDTDSDLARIDGHDALAKGRMIRLEGRVTDAQGRPLGGVRIELWQADAGGRYLHSADPLPERRDQDFQGFGIATTDAMGQYRFRTVVPAGYGSRPPHFHVRLLRHGRELLVTQLYLPGRTGEPGLAQRRQAIRDAAQTIRLEPGSRSIPLGRFDFIVDGAGR